MTDLALDELIPAPAPPRRPAGQLQEVRTSSLHPDPDNPRADVGDVSELADSIEQVGLIQPIIARRDGDQLLGWSTVPVVIRPPMRSDDVLAQMLVENSHRVDLDPIEEARALKVLADRLGTTTQAQLASKIGRTQVHVSGRLALLDLPVEEQELVRAGQMNLGDGIRRGRETSGKVRATSTGSPHLGIDHDLSSRARARCQRLKHKRAGRNSVGGVACGQCWESVIRADERQHLHDHAAKTGECPLCRNAYGTDAHDVGGGGGA